MGGKERFFGDYQIGKLDAMNWAKDALLVHQETIHCRDEQLKNSKDTSIRKEPTIGRQLSKELNRAEAEKVLAAIKAKQASLGHGVIKQIDIQDKGQALSTQQIQQEVKLAAQEAPLEVALGPIRTMLVWLLKKLPDRVYKLSSAAVILSMALSACSAINRTDIDPGQINPITTEAPEVPATGGQEMPVEPAEVVLELSPVEAALAKYEAGENLDISNLTQEEFVEFSAKLAEKKNEKRGINPIIYNNEAYISPDNYMMMNYDGHPDMNETIEMFVPIVGKDSEGNLQFENKGEIVTIPGSAEMDWDMRVSELRDPRINWPKTKVGENGLTEPERKMSLGVVITPMIMLDKDLGQFYLSGKNAMMESTLNLYQIETDEAGNPLLAKKIIIHVGQCRLYAEGSSLEERANYGIRGSIQETSRSFYNALVENAIYYVSGLSDPTSSYNTMEVDVSGYRGIVPSSEVRSVLLRETQNDQDMLVSHIIMLIIKSVN